MGERNNVMCSYMGKSDVFADFLNASGYDSGVPILKSQVEDYETYYSKNQREQDKKAIRQERNRDVLKKICRQKQYIVMGIEGEDSISDIMPFRCMEYDAAEYGRQIKRLRRKNIKEKKLSSDEYLSGVRKTDKLIPVVSIVFYYGTKKEYTGCQRLHDMLDLKENNKPYKGFVADYRINLVTLSDLDEAKMKSNFKYLVGIMKRSREKEEFRKYCKENEEVFSDLDEETYDAIAIMINQKELIKKKVRNKGSEGCNMCLAMQEWAEEEQRIGMEIGMEQGIEKGMEKGERKFQTLTVCLIRDNRTEDIIRATEDKNFCQALYQEYGIA